jgi:hypothetical protein
MHIRNHGPEDYETFCNWWTQWGWTPLPYEFLPVNSLVVCNPNPVCAVFLYQTDTPIIWAENYISDKQGQDRGEAMNRLIEAIPERAAELGASVVMSAVRHNGLAKRLSAAGFAQADTGLTNYILKV